MCGAHEKEKGRSCCVMHGLHLSLEEIKELRAEVSVGVHSSVLGSKRLEQTVDGGEECFGIVLL